MKMIYGPKTKQTLDDIKKLNKTTERAMRKSFFDIGNKLISTSQQLISDPNKTGRLYYNVSYTPTAYILKGKGKSTLTKKTHRASAPGEAPANLSGRLRKSPMSLNFTVQGFKSITFGNKAPYAAKLEFGDGKVLPRPFMKPSIDLNKQYIENTVQSKIITEITAGGPT